MVDEISNVRVREVHSKPTENFINKGINANIINSVQNKEGEINQSIWKHKSSI